MGFAHELEPWTETFDARATFASAGLGLQVHDVTALTERAVEPFDVRSRCLVADAPAGHVVLTHFPVLSFEQRARDAHLLYSGHLAQLAPPVDPLPADGPVVVLSGHLHLRGVTNEGNLMVKYECVSARPPDAEKLPILDPADGQWHFRPGRGWLQPAEGRW